MIGARDALAGAMMMRRTALLFILSTLTLSTTNALAADSHPVDPNQPEDATEHLRGLEFSLAPKLGSVGASPLQAAGADANGADVPAPLHANSNMYGASIGAGASLGFRFHPLVSAGLRGDLGSVSTSSRTASDGTTGASRNWQSTGLYARVYPLALNENMRRYIDPWIATGLIYVHDRQSFTTPATNGASAAWQADSHAIGIPIGIGIDYRVTKWLSAGPTFEYTIMNPIAGCLKADVPGFPEVRSCTDDSTSKQGLVAVANGAWNAGITLRVTPF